MNCPFERIVFFLGGILAFLVLCLWSYTLWFIGPELHQGDVYRILYIHVPFAFSAFFSAFLLLIFSIRTLLSREYAHRNFLKAYSSAELGLLFTVLTLLTGSIWGRPTWGTWWTWDARLTTTFLLALLYSGYLLLANSLSQGPAKYKISAVMGVLIFADVPLIYKSVSWWRTLHQPPSLELGGSAAMDASIESTLLICIVLTLLFSCWLITQRYINLRLRDDVNSLSDSILRKQNG